jgi:alkaline phosphatase
MFVIRIAIFALLLAFVRQGDCLGQDASDDLREFQYRAAELKKSDWIHWGDRVGTFSNWTNHSNRLIPVYSYGLSLESVKGKNSGYRDAQRLEEIYGQMPIQTLNPKARYFDQTEIYDLQKQAWESGKKNIILLVFDGMDWQTTQAAATYKHKDVLYTKGRGKGLAFLDYDKNVSDFGFCVTSPHNGATRYDVNAQIVTEPGGEKGGGYSFEFGGSTPWQAPGDPSYLINKRKTLPHPVTDSASSATSMNAGIKTYNAAINIDPAGKQVTTLAHQMQEAGFAIGVVTSVPISHATPACVYSHNVSRSDYQDLSRDLLGIASAAHRDNPLAGVDVLIGGGWGEMKDDDRSKQGNNFVPGNKYLADGDLKKIDAQTGGKYVVAQRTPGKSGGEVLVEAAKKAAADGKRLFGYFGVGGGHLPYQTADGKYNPTRGVSKAERYEPGDILENPTLAEMTEAALTVLQENKKGFYLMVECGDVDWANHENNIDNAIGSVFSGDDAFVAITDWVEKHSNWDETCLILTADHGHMMTIDDPDVLTGKRKLEDAAVFEQQRSEKMAVEEAKRRDAEAKQKAEDLSKAKLKAAKADKS